MNIETPGFWKLRVLRVGLIAATLVIAHPSANAVVLLTEQFDYGNGNIVGNGNWVAHSGAGAIPIQVTDMAAVLTPGGGSREDANTTLSASLAADGTFYMGFDLINTTGDNQDYFAHFGRRVTGAQPLTDFSARVFLGSALDEADYTVGLRTNGSNMPQKIPTGLTFGETYRIVASYEYNTGTTKLWVNPTSELTGFVTDTDDGAKMRAVDAFGLRQGGSDGVQTIDNVIVATTFAEALGVVIPPPTENADFNGDGIVNLADYTVWRDNLGGPGPEGDADGLDGVTSVDYDIWKSQFGDVIPPLEGLAASTLQVPEPSTLSAICLAAGALLVGSRRRKR